MKNENEKLKVNIKNIKSKNGRTKLKINSSKVTYFETEVK